MDRVGELVAGDVALLQHRPHRGEDASAAVGWVEQHRDGIAELACGDVEGGQPS